MSNRNSVMFSPCSVVFKDRDSFKAQSLQLPATINEMHCAAEVGMGCPTGPQVRRYSEIATRYLLAWALQSTP